MKAVAEAGAACRACASGGESERLELSGSQQDVGLEFTVLLDSGSQQDVGLEFTVLLDSRPDQDARRDPAVLDSPADHDVFMVANGVESPPRGVARGEWSGVCARRCGVWSTAGSFLACLPPIGSSLASPRAVYSCSRVVGVRQRPCARRT